MLLTLLVCVGLIGMDQLFKMLAARALAPDGVQRVIAGVVEFRYVENDGAAFSLLSGKQGLLIVITSIALLAVAYLLLFRRPKSKFEYMALVMILSGGVGNLIDRIANGYVVDYINLLFVRFAVFNFADCLVCIGFVLMVIGVIRSEYKGKCKRNEEAVQESALQTPDE